MRPADHRRHAGSDGRREQRVIPYLVVLVGSAFVGTVLALGWRFLSIVERRATSYEDFARTVATVAKAYLSPERDGSVSLAEVVRDEVNHLRRRVEALEATALDDPIYGDERGIYQRAKTPKPSFAATDIIPPGYAPPEPIPAGLTIFDDPAKLAEAQRVAREKREAEEREIEAMPIDAIVNEMNGLQQVMDDARSFGSPEWVAACTRYRRLDSARYRKATDIQPEPPPEPTAPVAP